VLRLATPMDFEIVCALNLADVQHTSPLDRDRLTELDAISCYHKVACLHGVVSAFLLAMCSDALYRNENFEWFSKRYPRFIYVDRIVVSGAARVRRLGYIMYRDLFGHARLKGFLLITCEYNLVPPNETSRLFHDRFGFKEQGTQWVANGAKHLSLQIAETQSDR
jgi:hypothetical protein